MNKDVIKNIIKRNDEGIQLYLEEIKKLEDNIKYIKDEILEAEKENNELKPILSYLETRVEFTAKRSDFSSGDKTFKDKLVNELKETTQELPVMEFKPLYQKQRDSTDWLEKVMSNYLKNIILNLEMVFL